jgi:hypothetical protein
VAAITRREFSIGVAGFVPLLAVNGHANARNGGRAPVPGMLDHLVLVAGDLGAACRQFEHMSGVSPAYGGKHPGGTENALVQLGPECYLEIVAPQANAESGGNPWIEEARARPEPHLHAYCMRTHETLEGLAAKAESARIPVIGPSDGYRIRPDGSKLTWRLLIPLAGAVSVPFFIDWQESENPAATAPQGLKLSGFEVRARDPERVDGILRALETKVTVSGREQPYLTAYIETPRGPIVLTS